MVPKVDIDTQQPALTSPAPGPALPAWPQPAVARQSSGSEDSTVPHTAGNQEPVITSDNRS